MLDHVSLAPIAYIDPSAGSLVLQVVLGGLAGLAVAARLLWHRVVTRIRGNRPGDRPAAPNDLESLPADDGR